MLFVLFAGAVGKGPRAGMKVLDQIKTTVPVKDRIKTAVLVAGHTDEPGKACHRTTCLSTLGARRLHLPPTRASGIGQQKESLTWPGQKKGCHCL